MTKETKERGLKVPISEVKKNNVCPLACSDVLLQLRAPNRYRKMLYNPFLPKPSYEEFGCNRCMSLFLEEAIIAMQRDDYEDDPDWTPTGIGATIDNDWAIEWVRVKPLP